MKSVLLSPASLRPLIAGIVTMTALVTISSSTFAKPVPDNLGNGLNKIVENQLLQEGKIEVPPQNTSTAQAAGINTKASRRKGSRRAASATAAAPANSAEYVAAYKTAVAKDAASYSKLAITEATSGKYLVDIMPNGQVALDTLRSALQAAFPALDIRHVDTKYAGHGVLEGYIALDDAANIGKFNGVRSVILQLRPIHSVGAVTSQGVNQHRVNRIDTLYNAAVPPGNNWDGTGMSIGVMSDSFNSQPSEEGGFTTAQQDVASGDLPGAGNMTNAQPVVVLEDFSNPPFATNEGRGMCQIVADMAPKARIGFATADTGEVGFADNIRALAGLAPYTYDPSIQQGFKGDVVCDDVSYLDEPMFQDGIIAQGVIDVVNAGTTYCSSAANNWGTDGYSSVFRPVPNGSGLKAPANSALANTNIDLTGVDPALYAGGFHNFNPNGLDVAQTLNTTSDPQAAVFQWNDPYDTVAPVLGPIVFGPVEGDSTAGMAVDFHVPFTAGQEYVITEHGDNQTPAENFDAIVTVIDPNGQTLVDQDTGVDETVTLFAPVSGQYTIRVHPFFTAPNVPTMGHFKLQVNTANGTPRITQDFNLLFFDMNGQFIESVATPNFANNRPYEIFAPAFSGTYSQVQLVISRSNTTAPPNAANQLKYVFFGNGAGGMGPAEYNNYLTPVTFGHSAAAGANSVAAYSMFRPNLPEDFTSPGPVVIYFDTSNNRLATPELRLKPDVAAADGANNTFFPLGPGNDYPYDPDPFPNFYGTSAASPHCASIAALVLQAHGGPGSLTPAQVKTILQLSAFPHDLDPYSVTGTASAANGGTVTINVVSDNSANANTGANDPNSWRVSYLGSGFLKSLHFNPEGTPQTGGNPTGGNFNGFTPADFLDSTKYRYTPGMVFTAGFALGQLDGLSGADVVATRSNPAPPPSNTPPDSADAQQWTLNLSFPNNNFTGSKVLRFNNGRDQQQDATTPQGMTDPDPIFGQSNTYSADILGSGVYIPEDPTGAGVQPGMTFNGVISDGGTDYPFNGRLTNRIGHGYSPLDGFGFINAEAATAARLPVPGVVSRKRHGVAGFFDIPLPIQGTAGLECRASGPNQSYQLVFTFATTLQDPGSAGVTQGTGHADTPVLGPEPNQVTVNVTGVTNQQHLAVTLSNVHDSVGRVLSSIGARMDVLFGDVDANRHVDGNDVSDVQGTTRHRADANTFRMDVNASGAVDGNDVSAVRGATRTKLL